jgi:1,4-dihydroxy-6-naphthoate synthase
MKLNLGFSPCPNDTFIFDALVNGHIDTEALQFEPVLEDVETLNRWAIEGKLDITKLSFPALFQNRDAYAILSSGAALGKGVGPLLVAKQQLDMNAIRQYRIAIPGEHTTANFLLSHAFPEAQHRIPTLFSEIEDAVLNERVDLGVIIHENRFTYQQKGLVKICDLGEVWEREQGAAIPLGWIWVSRAGPPFRHCMRYTVTKPIHSRKRIRYFWSNYLQYKSLRKQAGKQFRVPLFQIPIFIFPLSYVLHPSYAFDSIGKKHGISLQHIFFCYRLLMHRVTQLFQMFNHRTPHHAGYAAFGKRWCKNSVFLNIKQIGFTAVTDPVVRIQHQAFINTMCSGILAGHDIRKVIGAF